jgi:phospholipid/cholesterol/gamma-HCH transport system substrate-binding protein
MSDITRVRKANDFLVGMTVIVFTIVIVAVVLWLKQADFGNRPGKLVVRSGDVGGVSVGNPVVIRGVRAGTVQSIALGESGWVVLQLGLDHDVELPPDPVVLLASSSLFGEWQATVTTQSGVPADRELRALISEARSSGDTLPGAVLPDIAQLTSVAGRIAGDVAQVAERVQVAFDDQAAREMRESIRNFARLSADLSRTVAVQSRNMDSITIDVQHGLESVNAAAATVNRIAARVDSSTSEGELRQLVLNSRRAAEELVAATAKIRALSDDFDRTNRRLMTTVSRADSVFDKINSGRGSLGMLVNDPRFYSNSDSLVTELRSLVRDVRANPRRFLNLRLF